MNYRKMHRHFSCYTILLLVLLIAPQLLFSQGVLFQNTGGDTLLYIADEGITGSLKLKSGIVPSMTTDKLYNVGGSLHWGNFPLSHMWNKNGSHLYYNDGKVGIGEMSPTADLEVDGVDGVLFEGTYGSGTIPKEGAGTRMMWYPGKAAFRVGYVIGTRWDDLNIGDYSTAMGYNTKASGSYSTAMGYNTLASGNYSTALGGYTIADDSYSTAMGYNTTASGYYSTAMGFGTTAGGDQSTAMGYNATASGPYSIAIGRGIEVSGNSSIGIGLNNQSGTLISQSNTMAIMGGKVGIGDSSPEASLEIHSSGTTEDPLRVRVGSATKLRVWASNGSISMGTNTIGPNDGLLVKGNIVPSANKGADLGADGVVWDDIYYDDLHNQGASAFNGRILTKELIDFPPLPKRPGSDDYLTERGDEELDPASMPPGLADENSLLTDEITSFNYKANYEQQLKIEILLKQVKLLEKRLNELEKLLNEKH